MWKPCVEINNNFQPNFYKFEVKCECGHVEIENENNDNSILGFEVYNDIEVIIIALNDTWKEKNIQAIQISNDVDEQNTRYWISFLSNRKTIADYHFQFLRVLILMTRTKNQDLAKDGDIYGILDFEKEIEEEDNHNMKHSMFERETAFDRHVVAFDDIGMNMQSDLSFLSFQFLDELVIFVETESENKDVPFSELLNSEKENQCRHQNTVQIHIMEIKKDCQRIKAKEALLLIRRKTVSIPVF